MLEGCARHERRDGKQVRPRFAKPESALGPRAHGGNEARIGGFHQGQQGQLLQKQAEYKAAICLPHHTNIGPCHPGGVHTMQMSSKRRRFSGEVKAKVALAEIRGDLPARDRRRLHGPAPDRRMAPFLQCREASLGAGRANPGRGISRRPACGYDGQAAPRLAHIPTGAAATTGRSFKRDSGGLRNNRNTP